MQTLTLHLVNISWTLAFVMSLQIVGHPLSVYCTAALTHAWVILIRPQMFDS